MKQLSPLQLYIYNGGGLVMIAGAILAAIPALATIGAVLFTIGTLAFSSMQMLASYEGKNLTIKRLRRQQVTGAVLLLASVALLWAHMSHQFVYYLRGGEWKAALLIATVFEVYAAFRLPDALKKAGED